MKKETLKAELLAPAGSAEAFYAAVNCKTDAVYLGLKNFSARKNADNFEQDNLSNYIGYAGQNGVKVYLAFNTLIKNSELESFFSDILYCFNLGADAFILQDINLGKLLKKHVPDINLHLSTQAGINNVYGAEIAKEYGFSRVILSRETNIKDIADISKIIDTEVFIQGALCTSFSGQCYFSSMVGGNSANRGLCKQPCRQKYALNKQKQNYYLSLSDLSLCDYEILKRLEGAGVKSFKIEGRMRSAEYTACAVTFYKKLLSGDFSEKDFINLKKTFNRGDYTKGYFEGQDKNLFSRDIQGHTGYNTGRVEKILSGGKLLVSSSQNILPGDAFKIIRGNLEVGNAIAESLKHPGTSCHPSKILEGNAAFYALLYSGRVNIGDKIYVTNDTALKQSLGDLCKRRAEVVAPYNITVNQQVNNSIMSDIILCKIDNFNNKTAVIHNKFDFDCNKADILILFPDDYNNIEIVKKFASKYGGKERFLYLPAFCNSKDFEIINKIQHYFNGFYCEGVYGLKLCEKYNKKFMAGLGFNIFNDIDVVGYADLRSPQFPLFPSNFRGVALQSNDGVFYENDTSYYCYSKELSLSEIKNFKDQNGFVFTLGSIQLMQLIYCPFNKNCNGSCCNKDLILKDFGGRNFKLRKYKMSSCRFEVYNNALQIPKTEISYNKLFNFVGVENCAALLNVKDINEYKTIIKNYTYGRLPQGVL